jgi:hypothetical protein
LPPIESIFADSDGAVIPLTKKGLDAARLSDEQLDAMLIELGESVLRDPLRALAIPLFGKEAEPAEALEEELAEEELLKQVRAKLREKLAEEVERHDLSGFFQKRQVRAGDSLIITMKPDEKTYSFEHEPAARAQAALIEERDRELGQFIQQAIKRNQRETARDVIFSAYGNLAWLKEYPGSHWREIVEKDDGLRLISLSPTHLEIASIDYRMMFDMLGVDEATERKLQKRRTSIEQEVDDFLDRLDEAFDAAMEELTEEFDEGGAENVIAAGRQLRAQKKLAQRNDQLIEQFFEAEKQWGRDENNAGRKASEVALLADYLSGYQGVTLEYATLDDLDEFLFDWYPRKVMNCSSSHAKQLAGSARDFYRFLVATKVIRSAKFAEVIYKLRELAGEKVELYARLPADKSGELFGRLFGWG